MATHKSSHGSHSGRSSHSKRTRKQPKKSKLARALIVIAVVIAIVVVAGGITAFALFKAWTADIPNYADADLYNVAQKTRVYAADEETLLAEFYTEDREPLESLDSIAPDLINATVDTEDNRFYEHNGVDMLGIARAFIANFTAGDVEQGASTIDMQFVRNTILSAERDEISYKRKVREAYISLKLEELYSKDEILLMYLNTINYGCGCYGIESAARYYFNKHASELTLNEAAVLAGIPQSPTYNNPVDYMDHALDRRNQVLTRMLEEGHITQEQYDEASAAEIKLDIHERTDDGILRFPYFASYIRQLLIDEYGSEVVFKGGLTVYTTLDVKMQKSAEKACKKYLSNIEKYAEASLVTIDPDTGEVLTMVGGKDYDKDQFNIAWQGRRQPGSCFKMFTLAAAIELGIDPRTPISASSPVTINGWRVENYANTQMGMSTIERATWASSNTAFARLIDAIGADKVVDIAHRMGITSDLECVESITLGSQGVCPLEMASAYATLVTDGVYHKPYAIKKIIDKKGNVLVEVTDADRKGEQVISPEVAYATRNVLKGVVTSGTATSAYLNYQEQAGKTGTSENYRDSWYCSITPQYSTAIWCGARDESKYVSDNTGGANCCRIWRLYMTDVFSYYPSGEHFSSGHEPAYGVAPKFQGSTKKDEDAEKKKEEEAKKKLEEEKKKKEQENQGTDPENPGTDPGTDPENPGTGGGTEDPGTGGGTEDPGTGGGTEDPGTGGGETPTP